MGIAVDLRNQENVDVEHLSFGSPDYVAPEQLKDRIISQQSDVYSLGIMLYELLAHERPFVGDDPKEIMKMQLYNPVPSLRLKRPDLPSDLDMIIWQSTAKNPEHRYQHVLELATAFQDIAQSIEAIPPHYLIATQKQQVVQAIQPSNPQHAPLNEQVNNTIFTAAMQEEFSDDAMETRIVPEELGATPDFPAHNSGIEDALITGMLDEDAIALPNVVDSDEPTIVPEDFLHTPVQVEYEPLLESYETAQLDDLPGMMTMTIEGEGPPNPYKGLRAFEEADEGTFFGREDMVTRLLRDFDEQESRLLALIGPSGSGKSSLVRAGLIPSLRRGEINGSREWFYSTMHPGDEPFRELREALLRVAIVAPDNWDEMLRQSADGLHTLVHSILPDDGSELLLFIDQFEEAFTLSDDDDAREAFLASLWYALNQEDSRLRLIITLRADFYDRPLYYAQFGEMLKEHTEVVLPLNLQELESAILGPAGRVGLLIDPALTNAILTDVHNQPGALPLLQYALTEMYERRKGQRLTYDDYTDIGGVTGALAQRAHDVFFTRLNGEEQNLARKLFLRIVSLDENGTATRRRVLWTEMMVGIDEPEMLQRVVNAFSQHRLLTTDRDQATRSPTVEIAHEALINGWQQLRQWIDQNRATLQKRQELQSEVDRWLNNARDKSYLASGSRLAEFEGLLNNELLALRPEENDYIQAGVQAREATTLRTRRINTALSIFSVVTLVLFVLALLSFFNANTARAEAVEAAELARSRELAASSVANQEQNDLALLLGV